MAAALSAWGLAATAQAADPPKCQMVKAAELPVRFEHNRPMVRVSINGKPAWFLIDTGAASSLLFGGAGVALGLRMTTAEHLRFYGVGGVQDAQYAYVDFELAGVKVKGMRLIAIGSQGTLDEAGILGRDFLGHWDIEFDMANRVVRLFSPRGCGDANLAYWTEQPIMAELRHEETDAPYLVRIKINGRDFNATFDSGAGTSVITTVAAREVGLREKDYVGQERENYGIGERRVKARTATFDSVTVGGEQISHPKLQVSDLFGQNREMTTGSMIAQRQEMRDEPGMLLGADYLRSHRVLLGASQHVFYASYNGGPIFQVVGVAGGPPAVPSVPAATTPPPPSAAPGG